MNKPSNKLLAINARMFCAGVCTETIQWLRDAKTDFPIPFLTDNGTNDCWFQQDWYSSSRGRFTVSFVLGRLISTSEKKIGDFDWPPRSSEWTPLDFFLWGYSMSRVYVDKPRTPELLKDYIDQESATTRPETFRPKEAGNDLKTTQPWPVACFTPSFGVKSFSRFFEKY